MILYRLTVLSLVALIWTGSVDAQNIQPRIAGLESNTDYMTLLAEDAKLQSLESTVVSSVEQVRQSLRDNPAERQQFSQKILELEGRIFEIRTARGRLVDKINAIEQEWVFSNLNNPTSSTALPVVSQGVKVAIPETEKRRNLVDNSYFAQHLSPDDYSVLRRSQQMEMQAMGLVNSYFENYSPISELATSYITTQSEAEAVGIYARLDSLQRINSTISDSLSGVWDYIFDNKSYSYSFILEEMRRDDLLAREEERLSEASRQLATIAGQVASEEVADYFLRKSVAVEFEISVAEVLGLKAAQDSLRGLLAQIKGVDFRLPRVEIQQRYFFDYDSLRFSSPSIYTTQNPIPEVRTFAKGTIYRVQLGTFTAKRPVSVFRGVSPLSYMIDEEGKWRYFAGGFAERDQVIEAQKILKGKGFARPEIVVWNDGVYHNISRDANAMAITYRVEIMNVESLSDGVKAAISANSDSRELSRVGTHMFVIGMFEDRALADKLADAIRVVDSGLEIKIAEIGQ